MQDFLQFWPVLTSVAAFFAADMRAKGRSEAEREAFERRLTEVEAWTKSQQLTNLAVAGALGRLESIDERLGRIEDRLTHFPHQR